MSLGIVVEGGGVRAIYAAGVLDTLADLNLPVKGVIGVSAGAIHGCSFVSGQKGRSLRFYKKYLLDDRFCSFKTFVKTGNIVDTQFCYHDIPERLDIFDEEAFEASGIQYFVTCTNVETGKPEYLELKNMFKEIDGLRASASLPYLSKIVQFRGLKLLDGGCSDRVPLKAFQELGFDKNIVIMTKPRSHRVRDIDALLAPIIYRGYPNFVKTFQDSPRRYSETQDYIDTQVALGNAFVIRPTFPIQVGRLSKDVEEMQRAYDQGVLDTQAKLQSILEWVQK